MHKSPSQSWMTRSTWWLVTLSLLIAIGGMIAVGPLIAQLDSTPSDSPPVGSGDDRTGQSSGVVADQGAGGGGADQLVQDLNSQPAGLPGLSQTDPLAPPRSGAAGEPAAGLPGLQVNSQPPANMRRFRLQHVDAAQVATVLDQLYPGENLALVVSPRANDLLCRSLVPGKQGDELLESVAATIRALDQPADLRSASRRHPASPGGQPPRQLIQRYHDLERSALQTAERLRGQGRGRKPNKTQVDALRKIVQSAFETRQQMQLADVRRLKDRLQHVEQQIQSRARIKQQIIDRRVAELLDPALPWDAAQPPQPSGPAGPSHVPGGGPPGQPPQPPGGIGGPGVSGPAQPHPPGGVGSPGSGPAQPQPPGSQLPGLRQDPTSGFHSPPGYNPPVGRSPTDYMQLVRRARNDIEQINGQLQQRPRPAEEGRLRRSLAAAERELQTAELEFRSQLKLARNQVDSSAKLLENAKRDYDRMQQLHAAKTISVVELDAAESTYLLTRREHAEAEIWLQLFTQAETAIFGKAGQGLPAGSTNAGAGAAVARLEVIVADVGDGPKQSTSAAYLIGTVVSPEGHVVIPMTPGIGEKQIRESIRSTTVTLAAGGTLPAKVVAVDDQFGVVLLQVQGRRGLNAPFAHVPPAGTVEVATDRRLTMHHLTDLGQGNFEPASTPCKVAQADYSVGDQQGFFTINGFQNESNVGAPLVSLDGALQGIVAGTVNAKSDGPPLGSMWAVPAGRIARLLETVRK